MYVWSAAIWKKSTNRDIDRMASWPLLGMFHHVGGGGGYVTTWSDESGCGVPAPSGKWLEEDHGESEDLRGGGIVRPERLPSSRGVCDRSGSFCTTMAGCCCLKPLPDSRMRGVLAALVDASEKKLSSSSSRGELKGDPVPRSNGCRRSVSEP